jgi:ribose transport system substrate-binding protein
MSKRFLLLILLVVVAVISVAPIATAQDNKPKVAFIPGIEDPFYRAMQVGVEKAMNDFGLEVIVSDFRRHGETVQTPILEAMVARGGLNYIITPNRQSRWCAAEAAPAGIESP